MTAAKATEYRIIRRLLARTSRSVNPGEFAGSESPSGHERASTVLDRGLALCSAVLAATALVFMLGSYLQELLWVLMAGITMFVLGGADS